MPAPEPDLPDLLLVVEVVVGRLEPLPEVVQVAVAAEGVALEVELLPLRVVGPEDPVELAQR